MLRLLGVAASIYRALVLAYWSFGPEEYPLCFTCLWLWPLGSDSIHQPVCTIISKYDLAGSNFAMMSARTYASTVMQRAGLSVENPVAGLPYGKRWYQTQNTFVMAWLILWGRKVNPGRMRYYIRFDVDVEGKSSASLHLSGVSTCTFQGGRRDLPPKYWWTGYIVVSVLELV